MSDMEYVTTEKQKDEWLKCKLNPFYFIYNYVYLREIGGKIKVTPQNLNPKMKRMIKSIVKFHNVILMASRQLGKSATSAMLISWALLFYQESETIILNFRQDVALRNLETIKFIFNCLPTWMTGGNPFKSKSDYKTRIELFNNSRVSIYYPSTAHKSSTLARSLTSAILYIDEASYIKDMYEIWGSAQQTLSKASLQAKQRGYPYFQLITSTPNGTEGDGEWFYKRWMDSVSSDLLFDYDKEKNVEVWSTKYDLDKLVNDPNKNNYVSVRYHWSEDPTKNQEWYLKQIKELADSRKVNQELDLKFVGAGGCIFSDDLLDKMKPKKVLDRKPFIHSSTLDLYTNEFPLTNKDYYIIGCDTAASLEGAYNAIQIFRFSDFFQIGELQVKLASYTHFGQIINEVFQWLYRQVGEKIILNIENNTIGRAPIEYLLNHVDFPYQSFMFKEEKKNKNNEEFGIKTTGISKPLMFGTLIEVISEFPNNINSQTLISQYGSIRRMASGSIKSSSYSDLAMASAFCAFARKYKALEIMPMIYFSEKEIEQKKYSTFKSIFNEMAVKKDIDLKRESSLGDPYEQDDYDEFNNLSKHDFNGGLFTIFST